MLVLWLFGALAVAAHSAGRADAQMTLMYSNPALCAVFAWIIGTEAVSAVSVAGVAATVVGVVFIAQPPFLFGQAAWDETRLMGALNAALRTTRAPAEFPQPCLLLPA
jgi:drug/metabolite transporter (DMT)-like permease